MTVELIYETHSISEDNERGIATGWRDGALSARGRGLAAELGARHRETPPHAVYSSDLGRAVETARIAFGDTGIPIHTDVRLREVDYGLRTGIPVAELDAIRADHVRTPFPDGESYVEATARVASFLDDVRARWDGHRLVAIGHAATRYALAFLLDGVPLEDAVSAPFDWRPGWRYVLT
jgi:broad specificity phosphatase PhoE